MPPRPTIASVLTNVFPPKPEFKPHDVPDLSGKVYIVTGSNTGVGKELAQMLYSRNARVYVAARNEPKALAAMADMRANEPKSTGELVFLHLDLSDLSTLKASAETFLSREPKLHVLFNNAAILSHDLTSKTAQGHEMNVGVNCLGTFLFTQHLTPVLKSTAAAEPEGAVRVVWVASSGAEFAGQENVGLATDNLDFEKKEEPGVIRYALSKAGNWLHAVEYAKRHQADGIVSVALNPGNLSSELFRERGWLVQRILRFLVQYPPVYGAYTELYAGLSGDITLAKTGSWVIPWGRIYPIREDLVNATKTKTEGGSGGAADFWDWSEEQAKPYL